MQDAQTTYSFSTILPATQGWVRDIEVVGKGIGVDLANKTYNSRQIGEKGEEVAALYLERKGIEILERNWRCSFGEVDIIAREDNTIILLEVKTRTSRSDDEHVAPELAVGSRKRAKYEKLALIYLAKQVQIDSVRFDVAAVRLVDSDTAYMRYLVGAYEWDY